MELDNINCLVSTSVYCIMIGCQCNLAGMSVDQSHMRIETVLSDCRTAHSLFRQEEIMNVQLWSTMKLHDSVAGRHFPVR